MPIEHVLAVVSVSDARTAWPWYERLFGREPDNRPMANLAEWRLTDSGWLQVFTDPERAGRSLVNVAVDDIERYRGDLATRGLSAGAVETVGKGVRLSAIDDPDGNTIRLIGGFRVRY